MVGPGIHEEHAFVRLVEVETQAESQLDDTKNSVDQSGQSDLKDLPESCTTENNSEG